MYESAYEGSEYPHGEGVVFVRNSDYEFARALLKAAESCKKKPSELNLSDMPADFQAEFRKNKKAPDSTFANILNRKYLILEDIPKDDPSYDEFSDYFYRKVIQADGNSIYNQMSFRYVQK